MPDAPTGAPAAASAPSGPADEYMSIAQLRFSASKGKAGAKEELLALIKKREMAPLYSLVCEQLGWPVDAAKLSALEAANAAKLTELTDKVKANEESEGESEIREAYLARANFLMKIGERDKAFEAMEEANFIFHKYDSNKNGQIDEDELAMCLQELQVRINGRDRVTLTMRVDDQGSLALHKLQKSAKNPIRSPWFWVDARRPKRLDANARVRRSVQRARLFGKR